MSTKDGGSGTNHHSARRPVKSQYLAGQEPEVDRTFPLTFPEPEEVLAGALEWGIASDYDVGRFRAKSTERAVYRLQNRKTSLVFNDARLEGNTFTEPEVQTLLEGQTVEAESDFEANQILALSEGTDLIIARVLDGIFRLDQRTSNSVHAIVAGFEALDAGMFRGQGAGNGGGAVNAMGLQFRGPAPGERGENLARLFGEGLREIESIEHPVVRGATYAAFAAYNQFYFDGNKRTSRLMMNGVLMAAGYDAIVTPADRKTEYNESLRHMYEFGDARPYVQFTLSCYDDAA